MSTVSMELPLRMIEPATDELIVGMSWRSHRDEDRLLVDPAAALYGVFDGAGGHGDGAGAASVAAEAVNRRVRAGLPSCLDLDDVTILLDLALADADAAVAGLDAARPGAGTSPSATTASIAVICRRPAHPSRLVAVIANLGDSRVQLVRGGRLETVTLDHSYLSEPDPVIAKQRQDRLDAAQLLTDLDDPMDRAAFAHRHLLANALTGNGVQEIRHYLVELSSGDRLVLDSDGIHDNLTATELEAALSPSSSAHDAAAQIVAQAWERSEEEAGELGRSKPDDMTVLVLEVRELGQENGSGAYRLAAGAAVSLSLLVEPADAAQATTLSVARKQYLVTAADLQLLVAQRDGSWWAMQPGAAPGERGSWPLGPGTSIEFGRLMPGNYLIEPSDQVSRRHVALALSANGEMLSVTDLNSTNGTAVLGW
jgi:serine/threonine protein phosphatase PrpC